MLNRGRDQGFFLLSHETEPYSIYDLLDQFYTFLFWLRDSMALTNGRTVGIADAHAEAIRLYAVHSSVPKNHNEENNNIQLQTV